MSDDQKDHQDGERRYKISDLFWRDPRLTKFLRILDGLYRSTKFDDGDRAAPGNWPRVRIPPHPEDPKSTKKPPTGLPRNFLNPEYLAQLQPYELRDLDVQEEKISLDIPEYLIE